MPKFLFIILISVLGVSALAQTLAYSHLSHRRDSAIAVPMVNSGPDFISVAVPMADATTPVVTQVQPLQEQWSPAMVILVVTSILTSVGGLVTLVITTLTKSRVEIIRESGNRRDQKFDEVHKEIAKNTMAIDQAKARVEEVGNKLPPVKQSETENEFSQ